jgi:NAD(P)-dependent dehydrogenase (short-subunit alcohol dehydrogenase family)
MKPGARIIHIADTAGFRPYRNYLPYCVSKGALLSLTRALALELAPRVMVNSVSPGPIVPPPWESQKVIQNVAKKIPLQRWGGFDEIAKAVLFLCESNFATGINLIVDGGYQLI